jgi:hypothetical protein
MFMAVSIALALSGCGSNVEDQPLVIPSAPADQGAAEVVPVPAVTAFVDTAATNQRGDARYATLATNAGVRVLGGFLQIWKPLTEIVDAGVTAPAVDGFPAVVASNGAACRTTARRMARCSMLPCTRPISATW